MPPAIEKVNIAIHDRVRSRFKLIGDRVRDWWIFNVIFTVQQVQDVTGIWKIKSGNINLTAAAGTFVAAHTVGLGKKWTVHAMSFAAVNANSQAIAKDESEGNSMNFSAAGTSAVIIDGCRFGLEQNDAVGMLTTGHASDTAVTVRALVFEEDLY